VTEEIQPEKKQRRQMNPRLKEGLYALTVIFLLFIMFYLGQISTHMMLQEVEQICGKGVVQSVSPFGVNIISGGYVETPDNLTPVMNFTLPPPS
jgi:hypothetical protein